MLSHVFCIKHGNELDRNGDTAVDDTTRARFRATRDNSRTICRYNNRSYTLRSIQPECEGCRMARFEGKVQCASCNGYEEADNIRCCASCNNGPYCKGCCDKGCIYNCYDCGDYCTDCRKRYACCACDGDGGITGVCCDQCVENYGTFCGSCKRYICEDCWNRSIKRWNESTKIVWCRTCRITRCKKCAANSLCCNGHGRQV